jgi:hypothetical protein
VCKDVYYIHLAGDSVQWRGPCKNGNGPLGSVKGGGYLAQLSDY